MPMVGTGASKWVSFPSKISCAKLGYRQKGRPNPITSSFPPARASSITLTERNPPVNNKGLSVIFRAFSM